MQPRLCRKKQVLKPYAEHNICTDHITTHNTKKSLYMNIFGKLKVFVNPILELIYPDLCLVCSQKLVKGEKYICSSCICDFPYSDNNFLNIKDFFQEHYPNFKIQNCYSLFYYNKFDPYSKLIKSIKYHSRGDLAFYLGQMLAKNMLVKYKDEIDNIDLIIPLPLHPKRESERGFNQSLKIAEGISSVLNIIIEDNSIDRCIYTKSQTTKTLEERLSSMNNAFKLKNPDSIKNKHILLIDDVITTGSTIKSCLEELSKAENCSFSIACLAKTKN